MLDNMTMYLILMIMGILIYVVLSIWKTYALGASIVLAIASLGVYFLLIFSTLNIVGHPCPINFILKPPISYLFKEVPDEVKLLAYDLKENVAIYVWVKGLGDPYPRYYVLPWSEEKAKQLHQASSDAMRLKKEGKSTGGVVVEKQFLTGNDENAPGDVHPEPVQPFPPKTFEE